MILTSWLCSILITNLVLFITTAFSMHESIFSYSELTPLHQRFLLSSEIDLTHQHHRDLKLGNSAKTHTCLFSLLSRLFDVERLFPCQSGTLGSGLFLLRVSVLDAVGSICVTVWVLCVLPTTYSSQALQMYGLKSLFRLNQVEPCLYSHLENYTVCCFQRAWQMSSWIEMTLNWLWQTPGHTPFSVLHKNLSNPCQHKLMLYSSFRMMMSFSFRLIFKMG